MEKKVSHICRLCLVINSANQVINEKLSLMLQRLLPKSQFDIVEPHVCGSCTSQLELSYSFRLRCIDNGEEIKKYINSYNGIDDNFKKINVENICCLCFHSYSNFGKTKVLTNHLNKCVPELDIIISDNFPTCHHCYELVLSTYKFVNMYLEVEEKLKQYAQYTKSNKIELTNMVNFLNQNKTENTTQKTTDANNVKQSYKKTKTEIEEVSQLDNNIVNNKIKDLNLSPIKEIYIQTKTESLENIPHRFEECYVQECRMEDDLIQKNKLLSDIRQLPAENLETPNVKVDQKVITQDQIKPTPTQDLILDTSTRIDPEVDHNEDNSSHYFQPHFLGEFSNNNNTNNIKKSNDQDGGNTDMTIKDIPAKTFPCKKCNFVALSKNELKYHFLTHKKCKMYECEFCSFVTRHKNVIDNHNLTHMKDDEVVWYNCNMCTFRSRLQGNLEKHKFTHNKQTDAMKKYTCNDCPYRTMWKRDLDRHKVKHTQSAFACQLCIFSTKHERYLKQHIQRVHGMKDDSPPDQFFCANCTFSTKHKRSLIPHMVVHRTEEQLKWYKCRFCDYKAKWKRSIKTHESIHDEKYKCNHCDFRTTLKRFLIEHLRGHLPIPIYFCDHCDFSSSYKQAVTQHRLKHRRPEDIKTYQCPHCYYKSKRSPDLKQHIAILHAEDTELVKCEICSYYTRCKKRLKNHMKMIHSDPENVTKFNCNLCAFRTKYKSSLVGHQRSVHNEVDVLPIFKCTDCDYKTVRKELLTRHYIVHKTTSEVQMFECYHCSYKSKYKRALIKHIKSHENDIVRNQKILECIKCNFKTKFKQTLRKHIKTHAADVEEIKMEIDVAKSEIEWRVSDDSCSQNEIYR